MSTKRRTRSSPESVISSLLTKAFNSYIRPIYIRCKKQPPFHIMENLRMCSYRMRSDFLADIRTAGSEFPETMISEFEYSFQALSAYLNEELDDELRPLEHSNGKESLKEVLTPGLSVSSEKQVIEIGTEIKDKIKKRILRKKKAHHNQNANNISNHPQRKNDVESVDSASVKIGNISSDDSQKASNPVDDTPEKRKQNSVERVPLQIRGFKLLDIGSLNSDGDSKKYTRSIRGKAAHPYTIGYKSRILVNGKEIHLKVDEGKNAPLFIIEDSSGELFQGSTPNRVFNSFLKAVNGICVPKITGLDFFGFNKDEVQEKLADLIPVLAQDNHKRPRDDSSSDEDSNDGGVKEKPRKKRRTTSNEEVGDEEGGDQMSDDGEESDCEQVSRLIKPILKTPDKSRICARKSVTFSPDIREFAQEIPCPICSRIFNKYIIHSHMRIKHFNTQNTTERYTAKQKQQFLKIVNNQTKSLGEQKQLQMQGSEPKIVAQLEIYPEVIEIEEEESSRDISIGCIINIDSDTEPEDISPKKPPISTSPSSASRTTEKILILPPSTEIPNTSPKKSSLKNSSSPKLARETFSLLFFPDNKTWKWEWKFEEPLHHAKSVRQSTILEFAKLTDPKQKMTQAKNLDISQSRNATSPQSSLPFNVPQRKIDSEHCKSKKILYSSHTYASYSQKLSHHTQFRQASSKEAILPSPTSDIPKCNSFLAIENGYCNREDVLEAQQHKLEGPIQHTFGTWEIETKLIHQIGGSQILISTNIPSFHNPNYESGEHFNLSPSLLKSILQKNIRLSRAQSAVRVAKLLMLKNFGDFIRRISIIMIEDAILHPALPFIVWLTIANSKGYEPSKAHLSTCLRIVWDIASVEWRDELPEDIPDHMKFSVADIKKLNTFESSLIKSILARASLGGMSGDMKMLNSYVNLWIYRFAHCDGSPSSSQYPQLCPPMHTVHPGYVGCDTNAQNLLKDIHASELSSVSQSPWLNFLFHIYNFDTGGIEFDSIKPIQGHDIPLTAVDMHCSPLVDEFLSSSCRSICHSHFKQILGSQVSEEQEKEQLKKLVWWFRSCHNVKQSVLGGSSSDDVENEEKERLRPLYMRIKDQLDYYSYRFIRPRLRTISQPQ